MRKTDRTSGSLLRSLSDFTENTSLPKNQPHIELTGPYEIQIERCMGVLLYSDSVIRLALGQQVLLILGSGLHITAMFGQTVCVRGRISSLEFI